MGNTTQHTEQFISHTTAIEDALRRLADERIVERIWSKDASVWKQEDAHANLIRNALGWLTAVEYVREREAEIASFIAEVRDAGFRHVMLLGMGGSSLCPEVLRRTFGSQPDAPELLVLDTTDPDTISAYTRRVDLARTLFIVASKSGTTIEPNTLFEYFYQLVREQMGGDAEQAGKQFIAITDPGTYLDKMSRERSFRHTFVNPPDIGGRYSALSLFGIVPAALIGMDTDDFLTRAEEAIALCRADSPDDNPAARLGCTLGALALEGRNKLTLVCDRSLSSLGLWIEQLVAESTGKEGRGIIPIAGEPLGAPEVYGGDRVFVVVQAGDLTNEEEQLLTALSAAGHPIVRRRLADLRDLGGEFFIWEFATAVAGWLLKINPFDQPNVQAAKNLTGEVLDRFKAQGALPQTKPIAEDGALALYTAQEKSSATGTLDARLMNHLTGAHDGDYIALLAYLEESPERDKALTELRRTIRDSLRVATTSGYGPRYLHSTGQLHKGAPDQGIFIILTDDTRTDLAIPAQPYTFATLEAAQALGDFNALAAVTPRVVRLHLGADAAAGLRRLQEITSQVSQQSKAAQESV